MDWHVVEVVVVLFIVFSMGLIAGLSAGER
jgi:hypothetical protein